MITLVDTSFLFALANRGDAAHSRCVSVARTIQGGLVVSQTILPEAAYLIDSRLGHHAMRQFVQQMLDPTWNIEALNKTDLARAFEILKEYSDSRLDFVDATLIALAERLHIRRILTLDRRHFQMIRPQHCVAFEILPS